MNRLLVTGKAIGLDTKLCDVCNYDFSWLLDSPSILLWADRILITKGVWDIIQAEVFPNPKTLAKSCRLIFDIARDQGLVEIVNPPSLFDTNLRDTLVKQAKDDIRKIRSVYASRAEVRPLGESEVIRQIEELLLDGVGYCTPFVGSIYSSLVLAKHWNANCLFDDMTLNYLKHKFGIASSQFSAAKGRLKSFATVFKAYFPNQEVIPQYAFASESKCTTCKNAGGCNDNYLHNLENDIRAILRWRDYDEIQEAKTVFDSIASRRERGSGLLDPAEVAGEFEAKRRRLSRRMHSVFPKVKRWSAVTAVVSLPLAILGMATEPSLVTLGGAFVVGAAEATRKYVDFLESKYNWIGFLQKQTEPASQ
jgi:hypothetical protein